MGTTVVRALSRARRSVVALVICLGALGLMAGCDIATKNQPLPNILVLLSDDQSWMHTGVTGNSGVSTPTFDRVAREGVLFTRAFSASPSCSPSRAAILTGQDIWRLGAAANQSGPIDVQTEVYPDILEDHGYFVGYSGKGWYPGDHKASGRLRNPAGEAFTDEKHRARVEYFTAFLDSLPEGTPFCFWYGSREPHRPYGELRFKPHVLEGIKPPPIWPDVREIRGDLRHYLLRIEYFDKQAGNVLKILEERGLLHNTLVVMTSDNGMPFPRGKANLYDLGTRVPLAILWKDRVRGGRVISDLVSLTDLAPTFVDAAGTKIPREMTGHSLLNVLLSGEQRTETPRRDVIVTARERHSYAREGGVGYPARAIRTHDYLFIRNYEPSRWPAGDPPYFGDVDARDYSYYSPTKEYMIINREDPNVEPLFDLCFGKRPHAELYRVREDSLQMTNMLEVNRDGTAGSSVDYESIAKELADRLDEYLSTAGDARATDVESIWDALPQYADTTRSPRKDLPNPLEEMLSGRIRRNADTKGPP
ncbi:MAG: sulfatase [Candidatus Latescibacterota bacterium]|nr:MAG: sulfatase [Candidatus Latescibacterota bacterium]